MTDGFLEQLDWDTGHCIYLLEDMRNRPNDMEDDGVGELHLYLVRCYSILNTLSSESMKHVLLRYWNQFKLNVIGYRSYVLDNRIVEVDIMIGLERHFPRVVPVFGSIMPPLVEDDDSDLDLCLKCNRIKISPGQG